MGVAEVVEEGVRLWAFGRAATGAFVGAKAPGLLGPKASFVVENDLYLLHDLVWCGPCTRPLIAALLSPGRRYYGCPLGLCGRPLIRAEPIEDEVWQRFGVRYAVPAEEIPSERRQAVLRQVLAFVGVGAKPGALALAW